MKYEAILGPRVYCKMQTFVLLALCSVEVQKISKTPGGLL